MWKDESSKYNDEKLIDLLRCIRGWDQEKDRLDLDKRLKWRLQQSLILPLLEWRLRSLDNQLSSAHNLRVKNIVSGFFSFLSPLPPPVGVPLHARGLALFSAGGFGNCFFTTVSRQLLKIGYSRSSDYYAIRCLSIDRAGSYAAFYQSTSLGSEVTTWESGEASALIPNTFIQAVSSALGVRVIIFSFHGERVWIMARYEPTRLLGSDPIIMAHKDGRYEAVESIDVSDPDIKAFNIKASSEQTEPHCLRISDKYFLLPESRRGAPMGTASIKNNGGFWRAYYLDGLHTLLSLRLAGVSAIVSEAAIFVESKLSLNLLDLCSLHCRVIVLPIILRSHKSAHWVGVIINRDVNGIHAVSYIDPENNPIPHELISALQESLTADQQF